LVIDNRKEENIFLAAQRMQTGMTLVNESRMKDVLFRALKGSSDP